MTMADLELLTKRFIELYGGTDADIRIYHAPGRVNLIGEHTDYNGGYVFPAALTFGTTMLVRPRTDGTLGLASTNFPAAGRIPLKGIVYDPADDWMNFPKGIVRELQDRGFDLGGGADILYHGEIPNASGLSSSASIEVVTAFGMLELNGHPTDTVEIAKLAQRVENEFIGVKCGIMDQFAVANGRRGHAILLLCDTLEYELVPFDSGACKLVIGNTKKRRELADSKYNERRGECEQAVRDLRQAIPDLELLGQLSVAAFREHAHRIENETVRRRAQHVVEEIERVRQSVDVLKAGRLEAFGELMNASHDSLRDLYEVTGPELDAMVEAARSVPGVLGSRMTGAGFGGCTVSLVHEDAIRTFEREVGRRYVEATGIQPEFYVCSIGNGVERIR